MKQLLQRASTKRFIGVVLVILVVFWIRRLDISKGSELTTTALPLGFALVVAMVTGDVLRRFRLPRVTGYLLFGLLMALIRWRLKPRLS